MKNHFERAIHAAVNAGEAIMEVYGEEDFGIETKADDTPLTVADKRAHDIIIEALADTQFPVLSEEGKSIPFMNRSWWDKFWLVDPLDGTKEFIRRNGEFTVNIALVGGEKVEFGVVFAPVLNELYIGIPGRGAYLCRDENYFKQPLDYLIQFAEKLPGDHNDQEQFRVVASRSHYNEDTDAFIRTLDSHGKKVELVSKGSSLKLCMIASGEADIYPRLGPTMEWDTAAAHAIVKASGKNVYRADTGKELTYNKENLLNSYFVVK